MSYTPRTLNAAEERAYSVHAGGEVNFVTAAREAAMDMTNDERRQGVRRAHALQDAVGQEAEASTCSRANDDDGSRGAKMIRGESGVKIAGPASQWGRFATSGARPTGVGHDAARGRGREARARAHRRHARPAAAAARRGRSAVQAQEGAGAQGEGQVARRPGHVRKKRVAEARGEVRRQVPRRRGAARARSRAPTIIRKARKVAAPQEGEECMAGAAEGKPKKKS